jgi:hypothetical protein
MKTSLAKEARYFHACLFHRPADDATIERYAAAHRQWFADDAPSPLIARILSHSLDAEAVEFALRRRGRGRELTRKLRIVCYVVEARAAYMNEFVNLRASRPRAWGALTAATVAALWKACQGEYTVRRHGLL